MADKRIRQFFEFAEQNITERAALVGQQEGTFYWSNRSQPSKRFWPLAAFVLFSVLFFFIRVSVAPHVGLAEQSVPFHVSVPDKNIISQQSEPFLKSEIPSLHLGAVQQRLYPTPLRKAEQVVFHQEDEYLNESWVVRDRVVFIPKVIG